MTEQVKDQISAFVDDELTLDECMFLVRRIERDSEARRRVASYLTIGAALRGELVHPNPEALRQRVAEAVSGREQSAPPRPRRGAAWRRAAKPALGAAIAAGVAAAAVLVLRTGGLAAPGAPASAPPAVAPVSARTELPSYVVPQEVSATRSVTQPIRLTNYLVHHGEFASGLGRTWIHSSVVGAEETVFEPVEDDDTTGR